MEDDWLMSDEDDDRDSSKRAAFSYTEQSLTGADGFPPLHARDMASRESAKVQRTFYDVSRLELSCDQPE